MRKFWIAPLLAVIACSPLVSPEERAVQDLLAQMTVEEKIGQLQQINGAYGQIPEQMQDLVRQGKVGSVINEVDPATLREWQRLAVEESRLGIPLIFGRDVIHGFRTIFPIPLGQAASWNPELVKEAAHISAVEASSVGLHWTFAPMIDLARDARWGRIAESAGEDPYLGGQMAKAYIEGFQGDSLSGPTSLAACAKHFAGYGAAEGGRDYNTANIPLNELHNMYLPAFEVATKANVATFMTSFNDIDGVPSSGNAYLLKDVLRKQWGSDAMVVSDWASIEEMIPHGFAESRKQAAELALKAGVDMEMHSTTYQEYVAGLIEDGKLSMADLDSAVAHILRLKYKLGLFKHPYRQQPDTSKLLHPIHLAKAKELAIESMVLLENRNQTLPFTDFRRRLAVIGPMANAPHEQLGTWIFDGRKEDAQTPLAAMRAQYGDLIHYAPGLSHSRDTTAKGFAEAVQAAQSAEALVLFLGEESILSGEAHSRAHLGLPGAQEELFERLRALKKPLVVVVMAGRPLAIGAIAQKADALLYAWHPGTMAGPAIAELLSGKAHPSGRLPVTFPKTAGQIPIYYNHKNTGRPVVPEQFVSMEKIPIEAQQTSLGNTSHYLDIGYEPLYPFGYGKSYTTFAYSNLRLSKEAMQGENDCLEVRVRITNTTDQAGIAVPQLYVQDCAASIARPVRELKGFQKVLLAPQESKELVFKIKTSDLAFWTAQKGWSAQDGQFNIWVGDDSRAALSASFSLKL